MTKTNPAWTLGVNAAAAGVLALALVFPHPAVRAFAAGVLMLAVFAAVMIAAVSIGAGKPIELGTGRTTVLQGVVHLTILAAYLFLAVVP
jgi:Ca2+:H+ antiporter